MGYLTHFSLYNDAAHELNKISPEEAQEFCQRLYDAAISYREDDNARVIRLGNHINAVHAQRARHADDHCLYLHWGNSLLCLDGPEIERWARRGGDLLTRIKKTFEREVQYIRRKVKEVTS